MHEAISTLKNHDQEIKNPTICLFEDLKIDKILCSFNYIKLCSTYDDKNA